MRSLDLKEIQTIELNLMIELDEICRKHDINYCIMYGTLLGAVRHQGFIPWDDDMDIIVDRENYDKLINILNSNPRPDRFIQNTGNDKYFEFPITRYCRKNTLCIANERRKLKSQKYIYVDIFPCDNLPDDELEAAKQIKRIEKIRKTIYNKMNYKYKHRTIFGYALTYFNAFITAIIPLKYLVNKLEKEMKKYNNTDTKRIANFITVYKYENDTFFKNVLFPAIDINFDGHNFKTVKNTDIVLKQLYGDYNQLPPISMRQQRHQCYLLEEGDDGYEQI